MRFQTIRCAADGVSLIRLDKQSDGSTVKLELTNPSQPLPTFRAALQAFSGFAVDLVGAPGWHDEAQVSSLHLSEEPKTNRRGLIVTFTRKIERAKNRTVVVNTPLMHAPILDQEGTNPGTFPAEIVEMIATVEAEATLYWNGQREQGEIFPPETEAPQSRAEKGKTPGRGKNKSFIPGGGDVWNPDSDTPPTDTQLRQLLLQAERDVPIDAIATWSSSQRDAAQRFAVAVTKKLVGQNVDPADLKEPKIVKISATLPLKADEWNEPSPVKAADVVPVPVR